MEAIFEESRFARLKWACRRGMLELDVLLRPFVDVAWDELNYQEKVLFEQFLTEDDPDLYAWLMGHQRCERPEYEALIVHIHRRLQQSNDTKRDS